MSEVPHPTLALTQEALASAQGAEVSWIGYIASQYQETLAVARRLETPPAAIVIGGVKKGFDRAIAYDPNQPYYVAQGGSETMSLNKPLPRFEPTDDQLANLAACPIPDRWTTADLSELIMRSMYQHPSIAKMVLRRVAAFTTGGTATGVGATEPLQSAGYEATYESMALGGGIIGLAFGALTVVGGGVFRYVSFEKAKSAARELRPFPVWGTTDGQVHAR